jgi:processive 1,2-diacylglycerol beta-glucosyltransferase
MPKRVLVLSAAVGAGHLRAAQAVELALKQVDPTAEVQSLDVLEFTNAAFRRVYGKAYLDLVNKAPHVLGYFYDLMDRPPSSQRKADRLRLALEKLNMTAFLRFLKSEPWDIVVNTHFLPAELIASLRKSEKLSTPQFTVTTDYETHRLWVNQPCDHYFSATGEGAAYLRHWGVPEGDVTVSGIPIHPAFSEPKDRAACLARFGLTGDRPIVVQLSGGFGVGPIEKIFRGILEVDVPIEVVVVTGRNEKVKAQLEQIAVPPAHRATILGFTEHMDALMAVSDIVVSKPGGLTTSEVLASGAAMAVINPIPGQESRNSDYLLEKGAAVKINNVATLAYKLAPLLRDPAQLARIKENARRVAKPRAAFVIAERALGWTASSSTDT